VLRGILKGKMSNSWAGGGGGDKAYWIFFFSSIV
jgi:hypothetical protein